MLPYYLIITSLLSLSLASDDEYKQLFDEHLKNSQLFKCGDPQPKVYSYREVLIDDEKPLDCEIVMPEQTVIHRCDRTGCCPKQLMGPPRSCQPKRTEEVSLVFYAIRIPKVPGCGESGPLSRYIETSVLNHTECECQPALNTPKK